MLYDHIEDTLNGDEDKGYSEDYYWGWVGREFWRNISIGLVESFNRQDTGVIYMRSK